MDVWHFKCPVFGSVCSSLDRHCLCVSVSAAAAMVASAAAHLVPTVAAFPSMYSALSSSASCCRTFLRVLLLLVLLQKDAGTDPSQVEDVIEVRHWLSSCTAFTQSESHHLSTKQFRSLFHGGATPVFVCPWCQIVVLVGV